MQCARAHVRLSISPSPEYYKGMNKGGFSLSRLLGISALKAQISRELGVPLTKSGRDAKIGRLMRKYGGDATLLAFLLALIASTSDDG